MVGHAFFSKQCKVLRSFAFFCIRTLHSLRSFKFFARECCVLCVLYVLCKRMLRSLCYFTVCSLQTNVAFFVFLYVLKKRTQKNTSLFWVS